MSAPSPLPSRFPLPWAADWGEDWRGLWMVLACQGARQVFRWIPPGEFLMGSPEDEEGRYDDESLHLVRISRGFWLGETTVTQALWLALGLENPSGFQGLQRPVENVSWNDIHESFLPAFNRLHPELNARLPSEAEWEYACRAGTRTAFHFGDRIDLDKVNYQGTWELDFWKWGKGALRKTVDVSRYPPNPWGLYQMHGNVWEWCRDEYQTNMGRERVMRGGSWIGGGRETRSAHRGTYPPNVSRADVGFRLALDQR